MLAKMAEEFELDKKLCFIDRTPLTENDLQFLDTPVKYNMRVKKALSALDKQLPTFAVVDDGLDENDKLCLLIERGSFWGMGHLPSSTAITSADELKTLLNPYRDNDYIRNSIYSFVELNPEKKVLFI